MALILTRAIRGTNAFRTVFFMPNLIGGIVLGYIWQILLNCVLALLERPLLELDATAGFWGLVILMCWQQIGYMMIIYVAGLQSIPETLLEAAEIDGATPWQIFWKVKLPNLMPSITICPVSYTHLDVYKRQSLSSSMTFSSRSKSLMAYQRRKQLSTLPSMLSSMWAMACSTLPSKTQGMLPGL